MEFYSKPIVENKEVPLADEGAYENILEYFERWQAPSAKFHKGENICYIVSVGKWENDGIRDAQLREIKSLVRAQGDKVVGFETYQLNRPNPRTLIGQGAARGIADRATSCGADLLVIDAELSPSQLRNLEDATGMGICDREGVILNVFLKHAKTRRAKIQVEMAHLSYLRPRIRGLGLDMDQQAGGVMRGRGPGETASELMARHLEQRLRELRKAFEKLKRMGTIQRNKRDTCERAVLVGYTNAGKTSLMNGLTSTELSAKDQPFETLDTTTRCLTREGAAVLLSDTVGFIRRLPNSLLDSFETTLSEISEASLLVFVIDVSDPEWQAHLDITERMVGRLSADNVSRFYVFNKKDKLKTPLSQKLVERASGENRFMLVSSKDPNDMSQLKNALIRSAQKQQRITRVWVPYYASKVMAMVYQKCRILHTETKENGLKFTIEAYPHVVDAIQIACKEMLR
jgi:GTPase